MKQSRVQTEASKNLFNTQMKSMVTSLKASNQKLWDRGARIVSHLTDLDYEDSLDLLKSANGEVKTAIVMKILCVNAECARKKLGSHSGSLRQAIDGVSSE